MSDWIINGDAEFGQWDFFEESFNEGFLEEEGFPFNYSEHDDSPKPASPNNQSPNRSEYGKGSEHQKLQKMPHFGQPFKHLEFYNWLRRPKKKKLIEIGKKYNNDFQQEILLKLYPKFTRDHSRRFDLAYFFLNDNKNIIIPWITRIRMNSPNF